MSVENRETILREAVERFGELVFEKDLAVLEEFDRHAVLVGSEANETARGLRELRVRFSDIFSGAHTIRFDWDRLDVAIDGDIGWFYASGNAVVGKDGADRRLPYRLTGVLSWRDGRWLWQHFHGSEPAG